MRFAVLALIIACAATGAGAATAQPARHSVVDEARVFMEGYARDLAKGDRAAVAARYDRTGAFFPIGGARAFSSHASIVRDDNESWRAPVSSEWTDLHFDAAGRDAVVVNGRFLWGTPKGPQSYTYAGFLRRQGGHLRIRLEAEALETPAP